MRPISLLLLVLPVLLTGCISYTSSEAKAPDYSKACVGKESQCKELCGSIGIQLYSCKAAPNEGMDYKCECKKPNL